MDKTALRARRLGIPQPKHGAAPCVLPGHADHHSHLYWAGEHWLYWCAADGRALSLAQVRAVLAYASIRERGSGGRSSGEATPRKLPGRVEVSRWGELLDYETELLAPRPVALLAPDDLSKPARRVAAGVELLLGLRNPERWRDEGIFTFARRFAAAWCHIPEHLTRVAIEELRQRRVIVPTGEKAGRALEYRLGTAGEVLGARSRSVPHDELIELLKSAFDAEEFQVEPPTEVTGSSDGWVRTWRGSRPGEVRSGSRVAQQTTSPGGRT